MKILLSIGGASGSIYGIRLFEELLRSNNEVHLIASDGAKKIIKHETDCSSIAPHIRLLFNGGGSHRDKSTD